MATMRIQRLRLVNWRNHKETEIELEPISVFVGRNGAGKSSIAAGIDFLLRGKTEWTEGQGLDALVRNNAGAAEVAADIEGVGRVVRSIPHELRVDGVKAKAIGKHQEALYAALGGITEAEVAAAVSGRRLTDETARAGAMIAARLGLHFEQGQIKQAAAEWIRKHRGDHEAAEAALRLIDRQDNNPLDVSGGVEVLEKIETALRAERTAYNRIVRRGEPDKLGVVEASPAEIEQRKQVLAELEKRRAELSRDEIEAAKARMIEAEAKGKALKETIDRLEGADGSCPLAPDRIKCPLERAYLQDLVTSLKAERDRVSEEWKAARVQADLLESEYSARCTEIESEIGRIRAEIAGLESANRALEEWKKRVSEYSEARTASKALDLIIEAVSEKGFLADMLAERLPGLMEQVNGWLQVLTEGKYRVAFRWEKGMQVDIEAAGRTTPLRLLSESEQKRVGIVLQAILAKLSGIRFIMVDEADELDPDNRAALVQMIRGLLEAGVVDQAIILSTIGDIRPRDPGIPGVGVYLVEGGMVSRLRPEAA